MLSTHHIWYLGDPGDADRLAHYSHPVRRSLGGICAWFLHMISHRSGRMQGMEAAAAEVDLQAGQILYLPAGWFHEVTSFSTASSQTHLALNYWFQPPDNLDPSPAGLARPYRYEPGCTLILSS